jgi:hypothetical protein
MKSDSFKKDQKVVEQNINFDKFKNSRKMINIHDFYFIFQLFVDPNKLLPLARFLPRPAGSKPTGGGGRGGGGRGGGRGMILLFAAV